MGQRFIAAQLIGKLQIGSRGDSRSATSAEFCAGRITGLAACTEHLDRLRRPPFQRRIAQRYSATAAKFYRCTIRLTAPRTGCTTRRGRGRWRHMQFTGNRNERRVAAAPAEFYAFGKARLTLRAHHDHQRGGLIAVLAGQTATARRRQLIARGTNLQLRFNDLFGDVFTNLDDALVVCFARSRNAQHVLAGCERSQDHAA